MIIICKFQISVSVLELRFPINVVRTNKLLIRYKKSQEITNDEQIESFEFSVYKDKIV